MAEINIYNCDCMEFMKSLPDKAYDLAIVDPPYGLERLNHKGRLDNLGDTTKWNKLVPTKEYFSELIRTSNNQIVWGANYFDNTIGQNYIIWDKREGFIPCRSYGDCELASCSIKGVPRVFRHYWDGFLQREPEHRIHPTQKPVALYQWLLKNYAKQGDKILDTHGGSCSIAIACDIMGFDLDVCELDTDYYNAAVERFERHKRQGVLQFD